MTTLDNENLVKTSNIFYCKSCDYNTSRKYNYDLHVNTIKHKNNEMTTENNDFLAKTSNKAYMCDICDRPFNDRAGLWRHRKKCTNVPENNVCSVIESKTNEINDLKEIMKYLMKENSEMKTMIMEVVKNGITIGNPTDGGFYALWSAQTAMSTNPATLEVPVRYKSTDGTVYQGATLNSSTFFAQYDSSCQLNLDNQSTFLGSIINMFTSKTVSST